MSCKHDGVKHYRKDHEIRPEKDKKGNIIARYWMWVEVCDKCGANTGNVDRRRE